LPNIDDGFILNPAGAIRIRQVLDAGDQGCILLRVTGQCDDIHTPFLLTDWASPDNWPLRSKARERKYFGYSHFG